MNYEKLAERIRGKKVIVYGAAWSGKTTLVLHLLPHLGTTLYIDSDMNYPIESTIRRLKASAFVRRINNFPLAIKAMEEFTGDTVVVDSLAGLISQLYERETVGSPRINLLSAQYQEKLIRTAGKFKTAVIITHVGADFKTGAERIRINQALLRYIDMIIKVDVENERRILRIRERKPVESPEFKW